jgi:glycerophosphoryl diester phosphodiesterase
MLKIGHRGAPHVAPANTLKSFEAAHRLGCDWAECDCRISSDGVVVLAHDPVIVARDGSRHTVAECRADALASLDLGADEGVPSLAELAEWCAGRMGLFADVKVGGCEAAILEALRPLPNDRIIVCGADAAGRREFRRLAPELRLSITVDARHEAELVSRWAQIDTHAVTFEHPLITAARLADLHGRGVRVFAWTVDELDRMRALAQMGVDGIITNRPDLFDRL